MCLIWQVTESITSIASNIAQVKTKELEAAEIEGGAISKFIQAFEEQISRVEVADAGMLNIQQPNVAVQVIFNFILRALNKYFDLIRKLNVKVDVISYVISCMD